VYTAQIKDELQLSSSRQMMNQNRKSQHLLTDEDIVVTNCIKQVKLLYS